MASENNTGYGNIFRQAAGNEVRKRLGFKKGKYEAGEILIRRLYRNRKEGQFHANIRWTGLDNLDGRGDETTIQDIKSSRDVRVVNEKAVDRRFRCAYCATCHSRQGTSIDGNITIHEWNKECLASKERLSCSIVRARDFDNVYVFFKN